MKPFPLSNNRILQLSALVLVLTSFFSFQNCSQVHFLSSPTELELKSENNGGGYGGKPDGEFYRFTPGFTCEGNETFTMKITSKVESTTLLENKKLKCGAVQTSLDSNLIESSIFQNQIIGYQDGIFEADSQEPVKIPANLVEVWCRDRKDQSGIETITYFNRETNEAVSRIYFATLDQSGTFHNQAVPDFSVSRLVTAQKVWIQNGKVFEVIVNRDRPALEAGLFEGHVSAHVNGQNFSRDVSCRLGGSLDSSIWPVRQAVDLNISSLKMSPDQKSFSFTSNMGSVDPNKYMLYNASSEGLRQNPINPNLSYSNIYYQFTSDSQKLVYLEDGLSSTSAKIMISNLDGGNPHVINSDVVPGSNYMLSGNSQYVAYNSNQLLNPWLAATDLKTMTTFQLNPSLTGDMANFVSTNIQTHVSDRFSTSPVGDQVAFICCNSDMGLYLSRLDGTGLRKIPLTLPTGSSFDGVKYATDSSSNLLFVSSWAVPSSSQMTFQVYAVAVDGSINQPIPPGWQWSDTNPTGTTALLVNIKDRTQRQLLNLKSGLLLKLPFTAEGDSFGFTKDGSSYYGLRVNPANGHSESLLISTNDGSASSICPGIFASAFKEIQPQSFVLLSNPPNSDKMDVYLASSGQACTRINSMPVNAGVSSSFSLKVSSDFTRLLVLRNSQSAAGDNDNQLIYMPLDGKAPIQINSPVYRGAHISSFYFLETSKIVIYEGEQMRPGDRNVFIWKAP